MDATSVIVQYTGVGYNSWTDKWEEFGWEAVEILATSSGDTTLDKNDTTVTVPLYHSERVRYKLVIIGGSKAGESNVVEFTPDGP